MHRQCIFLSCRSAPSTVTIGTNVGRSAVYADPSAVSARCPRPTPRFPFNGNLLRVATIVRTTAVAGPAVVAPAAVSRTHPVCTGETCAREQHLAPGADHVRNRKHNRNIIYHGHGMLGRLSRHAPVPWSRPTPHTQVLPLCRMIASGPGKPPPGSSEGSGSGGRGDETAGGKKSWRGARGRKEKQPKPNSQRPRWEGSAGLFDLPGDEDPMAMPHPATDPQ